MGYVKNLFNQASAGIGAGLTENATSRTISTQDSGRTLLILDVLDVSSWVAGTATIKVQARLWGAGTVDGATTEFTVTNLEYWDRTLTTDTAGATAITAVGLYEFDITGFEVQVVYTKGTATGAVGIRADIRSVSP